MLLFIVLDILSNFYIIPVTWYYSFVLTHRHTGNNNRIVSDTFIFAWRSRFCCIYYVVQFVINLKEEQQEYQHFHCLSTEQTKVNVEESS